MDLLKNDKYGPNPLYFNLIRRLNRGNLYLSSQSFEIWRFIMGMEVGNKCKILA